MNEYIEPFQIGKSFSFLGARVVAKTERSCLLVSPCGTTMLLSRTLGSRLAQADVDASLATKLVQNFFAESGPRQAAQMQRRPVPTFFLVDMTGDCNLNCAYCFRDGGQRKPTINKQELVAILDTIADYCRESHMPGVTIQPWGGEPLLAVDRIFDIVDYFRASDVDAKVVIETNGTLISDDLAARMCEAGIDVGISIDGPEHIHDAQRRMHGVTGSFGKTMQGIENLKRHYGNKFGTICVVTKKGVRNVDELLRFFTREVGCDNVQFSMVRDNPHARTASLAPSLDEVKDFYRELFGLLVDLWHRGRFVTDGVVLTLLKNLVLMEGNHCCMSQGCTGGRSIVSFDHKGRMFPCEITDFDAMCMGSIDEPDLLRQVDERLPDIYQKERREDKCDECPWWPYCRGGCTSRVLYEGSEGIDHVECAINETLYPLLANLIANKPELCREVVATRRHE